MRTWPLLVALLTGCEDVEMTKPDQCLRRELFQACMRSLPAGPIATHYNDWDEVVGACENSAYYQSLRKESQIKVECRP